MASVYRNHLGDVRTCLRYQFTCIYLPHAELAVMLEALADNEEPR